jgi:site-specific recombinase XerD
MLRESYIEQCLGRMRRWMALRGLAANIVATYVRYARQFVVHVDRPLATVTRAHIEGYVHTLVDQARSPRTRNVQAGAIRCLLLATVRRDRTAAIPRAKVPRVVRQILSGTEVARLLAATTSPKYRAIFMLAYGAGLRVGNRSERSPDARKRLLVIRDRTRPLNRRAPERPSRRHYSAIFSGAAHSWPI